ncbi:MAG TPA: PLP-dependent aminotransferase family protein [Anaerolineaceae bacterium]|nr:PLP-dependent aminotransferase family protein [Anaerolineaceae bacterium]
MQTPWEYRFSQRTQRMKASAIRELLAVAEKPGMISFGGGFPAPEVFPVEEFTRASKYVLENLGAEALQYGSTEGYVPLRQMISRHSIRSGMQVNINNILITTGSQQALDLLGKIFINRGDRILVESPTYLGALQAWNAYGAEYISVPVDEYGMRTDLLEDALRTGPKFIYVLPNFQNPTGTTLPLERRMKLIELADRYGVPIIEDDPYGQLRYEGEDIPSVEILDSRMREQNGTYTGNVIYLSTFSKILAPGLRLAWVVAPDNVIHKLALAKQGTDLNTSTFNQIVAHEVGQHGFIDRHVEMMRKVYLERRNAMVDSLEENMPEGVSWTRPQGGLFLWVTLPEPFNSTELLPQVIEDNVAYVPGEFFHADGTGKNTMRLNFSYCSPEKINEGIARLGKAFKKKIVRG